MVSRRALAPVATCGEATKPGLAPNGSGNQEPVAKPLNRGYRPTAQEIRSLPKGRMNDSRSGCHRAARIPRLIDSMQQLRRDPLKDEDLTSTLAL